VIPAGIRPINEGIFEECELFAMVPFDAEYTLGKIGEHGSNGHPRSALVEFP
jgi:hypothetical protein